MSSTRWKGIETSANTIELITRSRSLPNIFNVVIDGTVQASLSVTISMRTLEFHEEGAHSPLVSAMISSVVIRIDGASAQPI